MFTREQTFNTAITWMWRLATTMSSYDEELVAVSTVEEDTDPETNFLAAMTYHSRSAVAAW
jgi:hypothetical protein